MVKLNKIYTRTGDDGTTGLSTGGRISKHHMRVASYGSVDETNATIGLVRLHLNDDAHKVLNEMLGRIQNDLFDLGADLATPDTGEDLGYEPLRIVASQTEWLEEEIDNLNSHLEPLKSFVLPGGSAASAYLHLARTVSRRAEREMAALRDMEDETVSNEAMQYINRLSDFLFVAARYVNKLADGDVLWVPGKNR